MSEPPSEIDVLRAALDAAEARAAAAEDELMQTRAVVSASDAMIRHLQLQIAKLRREQYGHSAERHARLIEQLEMQLEDLETDLGQDRAKADAAAAKTTVAAFERHRPARKPFPDHRPRERVVVEAPTSCTCCGSGRIVKMGEDITATLEVIPRQWKVIQTVREKFTCQDQPAARTVSPDASGVGGTQPAGHGAVREVRPAPAFEPAGRTLCKGRCRDQPFHLGRSGRGLHCRPAADPRPDPRPCSRRRTIARG